MTSAEITRELHAARPVASAGAAGTGRRTRAREPAAPASLLERLRASQGARARARRRGLAVARRGGDRRHPPRVRRDGPRTTSRSDRASLAPASTADGGTEALSAQAPPTAKAGADARPRAADHRRAHAAGRRRRRALDRGARGAPDHPRARRLRRLARTSSAERTAPPRSRCASRQRLRRMRSRGSRRSARSSTQRVQVDDLQGSLDGLEHRAPPDAVRHSRPCGPGSRATTSSSEERARLQVRRDELVADARRRSAPSATRRRAEAAEATIQLELRTDRSAGRDPGPSAGSTGRSTARSTSSPGRASPCSRLAIVLAPLALVALARLGAAARRAPARGRPPARRGLSPGRAVATLAHVRWRTHGERALYESDWIRLTLVDVELPDGQRFEHHVVRSTGRIAASLVVHDPDRGVLLLWRHRFVTDTWGWEVPAGRVDPGETPAAAAAPRDGRGDRLADHRACAPSGASTRRTGSSDQLFHVVRRRRGRAASASPTRTRPPGSSGCPCRACAPRIARGEMLDGFSLTSLLWALPRVAA